MDEESIGIFGVLLIVTVLVMSQPGFPASHAMPRLPSVTWEDVMNVFNCDNHTSDACTVAMTQ